MKEAVVIGPSEKRTQEIHKGNDADNFEKNDKGSSTEVESTTEDSPITSSAGDGVLKGDTCGDAGYLKDHVYEDRSDILVATEDTQVSFHARNRVSEEDRGYEENNFKNKCIESRLMVGLGLNTLRKKKNCWLINDTRNDLIPSDVVRRIAAPEFCGVGTRMYYTFKISMYFSPEAVN